MAQRTSKLAIVSTLLLGAAALWPAVRAHLGPPSGQVAREPAQSLERPWPFGPSAFRIAVLPDTQHYSRNWPQHFRNQTRWALRESRRQSNPIIGALNLGDITDNNSTVQWQTAMSALSLWFGRLPFALTIGNHDLSEGGTAVDRKTQFDTFLPPSRFSNLLETFEAGKAENSLHRFLTPTGQPVLILMLEFGPRDAVLTWAADALSRYESAPTLVATHAYLFMDNTRLHPGHEHHPRSYGVGQPPNPYANDGEEIWSKLISTTDSIFLVMNGHQLGTGLGHLVSPNRQGHSVYQLLSNYQMRGEGGDGYLRVLEFQPNPRKILVTTYSPSLKQELREPEQSLEIDWNSGALRVH